MNTLGQVGHVLRKDLRRFWPLLAVLVGLLLVWAVVGSWGASSLTPLMSVLAPATLAVFAGLVLQEDPPAGDQAFWVTRPLSPVAVLMAKGLFVGIFLVLLPAAAQLPRLVRLGGSHSPLAFLSGASVFLGGVVALAALGASVTRDLRTFLLVLVAGAVAILGLLRLGSGSPLPGDGPALTSDFVMRLAWLGVGTSMVAHQVLTRRTGRTLLLAGASLLAVFMVVPELALDWSRFEAEPGQRSPFPAASSIGIEPRWISLEPGGQAAIPPGSVQLELAIVAEGRSDVWLRFRHARVRLRGEGFERNLDADARWGFDQGASLETLEGFERLRGDSLAEARRLAQGASGTVRISMPEGEWDELLDRADGLEASLEFDVYRPVVLGRLPLVEGATLSVAEGAFTLDRLTRSRRVLAVRVTRRHAVPALTVPEWTRGQDMVVALVNDQEGRFLPARFSGGTGGTEPGMGGSRELLRSIGANFGWDRPGGGQDLPDPSWMAGAELALIEGEYVGSFERTFSLQGVTWPGDFEVPVRLRSP